VCIPAQTPVVLFMITYGCQAVKTFDLMSYWNPPNFSDEVGNTFNYTSTFPQCLHWHVTGWALPLL